MKITIEIDDEKKVVCEMDTTTEDSKTVIAPVAAEEDQLTEEEAERYAAASDLANCCEYLEESELIKLKLIIQKCEARKERNPE